MADDKKQDFDLVAVGDEISKYVEKFWKPFLGAVVVGVIVAGVVVAQNSMNSKSEKEAFAELFKVTKVYDERKGDFEEAEADKKLKELEKDKKAPKKDDDKKDDKPKKMASGELSKDYGDVVEKLEAFVKKFPDKKAAGEAALTLSEIYDEYKEYEKAATVVSGVAKNWKHRDLIYVVLQMRAGDLWSKAGQCEKSMPFWLALSDKENFMRKDAMLKIGVCNQKMGRLDEAKTWYRKITATDPTAPQAKDAEKYLRFMDFQKKVDKKETTSETSTNKNNKES